MFYISVFDKNSVFFFKQSDLLLHFDRFVWSFTVTPYPRKKKKKKKSKEAGDKGKTNAVNQLNRF